MNNRGAVRRQGTDSTRPFEDRVAGKVWSLADRLLGSEFAGDDLFSRRQLQATALVVAVALACALPMLGLALHAGALVRVCGLVVVVLALSGTLAHLRARRRPRRAGLVLVVVVWMFAAVDSVLGSGLRGAAVPLLLILPVLGTALVQHRFGQLVGVVSAIYVVTVWWLVPDGLQLAGTADAERFALPDRLAYAVGAGASMLVAGIRQGLLARLLGDSRDQLQVEVRRLDLVEQHVDVERQRAELGASLAELVHEVSNPLTVALSSVELAAATTDCERRAARLEAAVEGIRRMGDVLETLESRTRERELIPLAELLWRVAGAMRSSVERKARFEVTLEGVTGFVHADATSLFQVFVNLIENATNAIPADGRAHEVTVSVTEGDMEFTVRIADTGRGLPDADEEQLFEPFWTTRADDGGTGLGLAICRRTLREHGGTIALTAREEAGAVAVVTLPRVQEPGEFGASPEPTVALRAESSNHELTRSVRVLVVDDEPLVARAIEGSLAPAEVVCFTSARAAIEAAIEEEWDAIVCDVMMPDLTGMDFFETVVAAAPSRAGRFLFVTGGVFTDEAQRWLASRGDSVLYKPFDREVLRKRVARLAGEGDA